MEGTRKYALGIIILLGGVFITSRALTYQVEFSSEFMSVLIDLEDSSESTKDHQGEKELKEYRISGVTKVQLSAQYLNGCTKYGQINGSKTLRGFLEILTQPPKA